MAFCRVVFPLLVLSVISCYSSKVPVFLWGDSLKSSTRSNPLTTYTSDEFAAILKQVLVDDPLTLVFIEETLSTEDFSLKNGDGETSFPNLHENIGEAVYLPTVKDALVALNRMAGADASDIIVLTEIGLTKEIEPISGKFVFINLNDAREGESRADLLRRHDAFMQEMISEMPDDLNVVAVYTANYPSWTIPVTTSRVRRAVEGAVEGAVGARNSQIYNLTGVLMVTSNIHVITGNDTKILSKVTSQTSEITTTFVNASITFADNTALTLNFISKGGYWFFDTVVLTLGSVTETLHPVNEELFAILGFSYRCSQHVSFTSINETETYTISFEDLKIQPFFEANTTQQFGDSFYCVGFFSAPIWAGLFVVFILLSITFYGIMMMLDIRTMDRFDDPKGKTITVIAE